MSDTTDRFSLPFIIPGQAQKELLHNEALTLIDLVLHAAVEDGPLATPPASPEEGQCWLTAAAPAEAWAGQSNRLAMWSEGGWRFVAPVVGMAVWNKQAACRQRWMGTAWTSAAAVGSIDIGGQQVLGPRLPAIASPSGGTIIDAEARTAISAVIVALTTHGLID